MRTEIVKLREQQAKIAADARSRLDEITDDTSEERAKELEAQFDAAMAQFDELGVKIERLEKLVAAEEALAEGDPRRPNANRDQEEQEGPSYRDVFERMLRFGASELSSEEREVLRNNRASFTPEERAQAVGSDSAGGYVVPQEFSNEIDRAMALWGPMWDADIVREINTTNGREIDWPTVDDTGNTGRTKAENAPADDDGSDDVAFGERKLNAFMYDTGIIRVPYELLQDSAFDLDELMSELLGERLGRTANTALTTGTGSSQPNGIVTASSLGVTAAGAAAITGDELINLVHSVDPAYRASPRVRWQFNDQTLSSIRKLKDGDGNYLWQMGDIRTGEPNTLLGYGYSVNQAMANIATGQRSIIFGDHSKYIVRKVLGFQLMTLRERYAENFQVGVIGFKRFDGELLNTAAVKHLVQA